MFIKSLILSFGLVGLSFGLPMTIEDSNLLETSTNSSIVEDDIKPGDDYSLNFQLGTSLTSVQCSKIVYGKYNASADYSYFMSHYYDSLKTYFNDYVTTLNTNLGSLYTSGYTSDSILSSSVGFLSSSNNTSQTTCNSLGIDFTPENVFSGKTVSLKSDGSVTDSCYSALKNIVWNGNLVSDVGSLNKPNSTSLSLPGIVDTASLTAMSDYGAGTGFIQDYYGLTLTPSAQTVWDTNVYSGSTSFMFKLGFKNGLKLFNLNPWVCDMPNSYLYFLCLNPLTGQLEWLDNASLTTYTQTGQTTCSFPGGAKRTNSMETDGGLYAYYVDDYAEGLTIYEVCVFSPSMSSYLAYNSYMSYCMAHYGAFEGGYYYSGNLNYSAGYTAGYEAGKATGSDEGSASLTGPFALIASAFNSVSSVLNLQVFGGITLGLLLFTPLIVLLIISIFKLLKG